MKRCILAATALLGHVLAAQTLTLDEAIERAVQHSHGSQIMQARTSEAEAERRLAEKQRLPEVKVYGIASYDLASTELTVGRGDLNTLLDSAAVSAGLEPLTPVIGPFPSSDLVLARGERLRSVAGLSVLQPLSQQWRIGSGIAAAEAQAELARVELDQTHTTLREAVEKLWVGLRLEAAREEAAAARVAALRAQLHDAQQAREAGEVLDAAVLGAQAQLTEARTRELQVRQHREALRWQLADLIAWDAEALPAAMSDAALPEREIRPLTAWLAAVEGSPDYRAATASEQKAAAGMAASRQERLPDLSAFLSFSHQEGWPVLPGDVGTVGLVLTWDPFDFGRREAKTERSAALVRQASLNRERVRQDLVREVRLAYQAWEHAQETLVLAREAESYRMRLDELAQQAVSAGEALASKALLATAEARQAQADRLGAELQAHLALLHLHVLTGAR